MIEGLDSWRDPGEENDLNPDLFYGETCNGGVHTVVVVHSVYERPAKEGSSEHNETGEPCPDIPLS